ncbi:MAG: ATP phosphoribosyltransferase [Patescibacteria group bacterium]
MFTFGIPKGKHIFPGCRNLFEAAGVVLEREHPVALAATLRAESLSAEGMILQSRRMLILLARGRIHAGIVGDDMLRESGVDVETLGELSSTPLGLPAIRVVLFAAEDDPVQTLDDIPEYSFVLTEYERLTRDFFGKVGLDVQTIPVQGGVEAEVPRLRRFGVTIVDSGTTLKANRLKEICTIITSKPVFVVSKVATTTKEQRDEIQRFACLLQDAVRSQA